MAANPLYTDVVMLFGDSLTQAWSEGSIAQRLSEYWLRRMDVLNRGFGGYNTEWALPVFEQIVATRAQRDAGLAQTTQLMTIWFGANDAVLPGRPQHIPLKQFMANLVRLVEQVRSPKSKYYSPETRIVLISPPPIIEEERAKGQLSRWRFFGSKGEAPLLDRDAEVTKQYADAVVDVGQELGVPTVDLWTAIVNAAGGNEPDKLAPYFYDGLHLTSAGYQVLYDELTALVKSKWPELDPETMPMPTPHWSDVDAADPFGSILKNKAAAPTGSRDEL